LRDHGRATGRTFRTIRRAHITTSARKFDQFGDWYLVRNPRLIHRIFEGHDREAAEGFYYDTDR
jgi:hypothetical protein